MKRSMAKLLAADRLTAGYGDSVVLEDVSLELDEGGSLALLGRNGVGKTTLLLTLLGLTRLKSGSISWRGEQIATLPTFRRAQAGLGWVPQERFMFPSLTLEEHLTVIARPGPWTLARVYALFPTLEQRKRNLGNQLSGGEQQMVAIARGLMARPRLLMLDEPSLGLAPVVVRTIFDDLARINQGGLTILLVEQNVLRSLGLCHRGYVLENGRISLAGGRDSLLASPHIKQAYLGL